MKHRARKRFGQHFLTDRSVIDRIVDALALHPDETLVEIGPGRGALTHPLLTHHGHLHVIEFDRDLAAYWREQQSSHTDLIVHEADALEFDFAVVAEAGPVHLVGNLPYNISTPLLFQFVEFRHCFSRLHIMLQKEVAERIAAGPGSKTYGRLSVMLGLYFDAELLFEIPPHAFEPPPQVVSSFLQMTPRTIDPMSMPDEQLFSTLVGKAFSQRRKMLRKSLRGLVNTSDFDACNIADDLRPEALSVDDFVRLTQRIASTL